jgi:hypothetical protein
MQCEAWTNLNMILNTKPDEIIDFKSIKYFSFSPPK